MLKTYLNTHGLAGLALGIGLLGAAVLTALPGKDTTESYIIQGASLSSVKSAVQALGGEITHELGVIRAVGARLTPAQYQALNRSEAVRRVYDNARVERAKKLDSALDDASTPIDDSVLAASPEPDPMANETGHVTGVGAHQLHAEGITGAGVMLAVLDSGLCLKNSLTKTTSNRTRLLAQYDAIADYEPSKWEESDLSGHGGTRQSPASVRTASCLGKPPSTAGWHPMQVL